MGTGVWGGRPDIWHSGSFQLLTESSGDMSKPFLLLCLDYFPPFCRVIAIREHSPDPYDAVKHCCKCLLTLLILQTVMGRSCCYSHLWLRHRRSRDLPLSGGMGIPAQAAWAPKGGIHLIHKLLARVVALEVVGPWSLLGTFAEVAAPS